MKKIKVVGLVIGLIGILGVGNVMAADTASVDVSATVLGTCSFDETNYAMAFGDINPADTNEKTATANVTFTCSNGTDYTLSNISGTNTLDATQSTDTLAFSIDSYTLNGTGSGTTGNSLTLTGRIAAIDYQNAPADIYTKSLTISINP